MDMNIVAAIAGGVLILAGLVFEARNFVLSTLVGYAGLLLLHYVCYINVVNSSLLFWGAAALLSCGIAMLSPRQEPHGSRGGNINLLLGAVAGLLVGMSIDASMMILAAIIGTLLGQLFYARTPKGSWVKFSFSIFIHYFCAVGLKTIVSTAIAGIAIEGLLRNQMVAVGG